MTSWGIAWTLIRSQAFERDYMFDSFTFANLKIVYAFPSFFFNVRMCAKQVRRLFRSSSLLISF